MNKIKLEKSFQLPGTDILLEENDVIEVIPSKNRGKKRSMNESHSREIANDLANIRFVEEDAEYITKEIAEGIAQGIRMNRDLRRLDANDLIFMVSQNLEAM